MRCNWRFLAPHPWTPTAKAAWRETWEKIEGGLLTWRPLDYLSQNEARKATEKQAKYRACEPPYRLDDQQFKTSYQLRWLFVHSSRGAESAAKQREKALVAGLAALSRLSGLVGKYHYRKRETITKRVDRDLAKAKASAYFKYTLTGTEGERDWRLQWERDQAAIAEEIKFDGISLMCTNTPESDLSANEVVDRLHQKPGRVTPDLVAQSKAHRRTDALDHDRSAGGDVARISSPSSALGQHPLDQTRAAGTVQWRASRH